ncbi:MAG: SDR family oxidoreductase [Phycisphaeraceae bacterium JB051]
MANTPRILLTGVTGYVGGRLHEQLKAEGYPLRCLARRPEHLSHLEDEQTQIVQGDVLEPNTLNKAMVDIDTAFYMVHSMGSTGDFQDQDRQAALNFGAAAKQAGVRRIIYLGGLGDTSHKLSVHLRSRHEVGKVLATSGVQVIELRAAVILGSGSLSFELIRALVERLPIMITPKWVTVSTQPIAIEDVINYLTHSIALDNDEGHAIYEIGGTDITSYEGLMREYASQHGNRLYIIHVPVLTPRLSSLWLGLVTPVYARVGRKLIDSIKHPTVIRDNRAQKDFDIQPLGITQAIKRALANEDRKMANTRWSDALSSSGYLPSWGGVKFGNRLIDSRCRFVKLTTEQAFDPIQKIGGKTGWYAWNFLWHIRGFLDLLVGGVGVRRGRKHPTEIAVGDTLDFWRVEAFEPGKLLRLAAEMKVPGRAWLEFEVTEKNDGTEVRQTALFDPIGHFGRLYWYALYPVHQIVFSAMLRNICNAAKQNAKTPEKQV